MQWDYIGHGAGMSLDRQRTVMVITEILEDPYYNNIPLPRIPYIRKLGITALPGVTAAAASAATVEYPQISPTCEWTVELSRIMISSHSMTRLLRMIN